MTCSSPVSLPLRMASAGSVPTPSATPVSPAPQPPGPSSVLLLRVALGNPCPSRAPQATPGSSPDGHLFSSIFSVSLGPSLWLPRTVNRGLTLQHKHGVHGCVGEGRIVTRPRQTRCRKWDLMSHTGRGSCIQTCIKGDRSETRAGLGSVIPLQKCVRWWKS